MDVSSGDILCGHCRAQMLLLGTPADPTSAVQKERAVCEGYRAVVLHCKAGDRGVVGSRTTLINKVKDYELRHHRSATLSSQVGFETFLTWVAADQAQPQSVPSLVYAATKLADGRLRPWLSDDSFRALIKTFAQKFGRRAVTAMELTVEHIHLVMDLLDSSESDPHIRATHGVMALLLFLGGFRVSEAAGDICGIHAFGVLLTKDFVRLTRPDSKTHGHEVTNYVADTTQSGLALGPAIRELCVLSSFELEPVVVSMRGQPVEAERINYYVLQLWFTADARPDTITASGPGGGTASSYAGGGCSPVPAGAADQEIPSCVSGCSSAPALHGTPAGTPDPSPCRKVPECAWRHAAGDGAVH